MKPQLFLDLDGVLADFDTHYEQCFGVRPNQDTYEPPNFWDSIRNHGSFYRNLPLMKDAMELWNGTKQHHPIILTGIPFSIANVQMQKRLWVSEHLGPNISMIACRSKDKKVYGIPGDVLVDDRLKYAHYWVEMGGVFVHHTSARNTLALLAAMPF